MSPSQSPSPSRKRLDPARLRTEQPPLTREHLYELVWREPLVKLAERLGVSSMHLAEVCAELRVPRPERGHWSKVEFGKASPKPELPVAQPGGLTEWKPGTAVAKAQRPAMPVERKRRASRVQPVASSEGKLARERGHELVAHARQHFLKSRKPDDTGLLRPYKRHLVDIITTEKTLDAALAAADGLFRSLNKAGHRVVLSDGDFGSRRREFDVCETTRRQGYFRHAWSPDQATVVLVGDVPIGLTVFETTELVEMVALGNSKYVAVRDLTPQQDERLKAPHYWRLTQEVPSRRLAVHAYSTWWRAPWAQRWTETKSGEFALLVPKVVEALQAVAPELTHRKQEADRRAEAEQRERERKRELERQEEERARRVKAKQDARTDLVAAIASWEQVRSIHSWFQAAERELELLPVAEQEALRGRLQEARDLVGEVDALEKLRRWKAPAER